MIIRKYRIVTDDYAGFECQIWRLWLPFWVQMGVSCNTHRSEQLAKQYIQNYIGNGHKYGNVEPSSKVIQTFTESDFLTPKN